MPLWILISAGMYYASKKAKKSMRSSWIILLRIFLRGGATLRFSWGAIFGLSFSMAVILSTIGIMDGFEQILKKSAHKSMGDFYFYSRDGFFLESKELQSVLQQNEVARWMGVLQTEGFMIKENANSTGVLIRGVDPQKMGIMTGLHFSLGEDQVVLGIELAKRLNVKKGDQVSLALASGKNSNMGLPQFRLFTVADTVDHGIYQQNMRMAYLTRPVMQELLNSAWGEVNYVILNLPENITTADGEKKFKSLLQNSLGPDFVLRPSWQEFSSLLEAVEVEKLIIGLILQVIVVVAIFNVMALMTYINEKKSAEIFLLRSLGLSFRRVKSTWALLVLLFWVLSSIFSLIWVEIFDWCLGHLDLLKLPGDIYTLERLQIYLSINDYLLVFSTCLVWMIILFLFAIRKLNHGPLIYNLRKELA